MSKWLVTTGFLTLAIVAAVPDAQSNATAPAVDLGRADFRTYCAACHGVSGAGDGTIAEFLTITAPDLTQLAKRNAGTFPRERVTEVVDGRAEVKVHGARDMPVWGDWFNYEAISEDTDAEARAMIVSKRISDLVGFLESIQDD